MDITSITYQKVQNLGGYESHRYEATAEVGEYDEIGVEQAMEDLAKLCDNTLWEMKKRYAVEKEEREEKHRLDVENIKYYNQTNDSPFV